MAHWAAAANCNSTSTAALASCDAIFMNCVDTEAKAVCDCNIDRVTCANEVGDCAEADAKALAWSTACKGVPDCDVYCPATRVEMACDAFYDVASERKRNCTDGLIPNVTLCGCWTEWNTTLGARLAQCPAFKEDVDEFVNSESLLCAESIATVCTPFENRQISIWSDAFGECTGKAINGTVTMVGAVCRCLRDYKAQRAQLQGKCAQLIGTLQPITLNEQLFDCQVNIDKDTVCDTRDTDVCQNDLAQCARAASVGTAQAVACDCYSDASKCIAKHSACPAATILAGTFHAVCLGSCPATVDCGPAPKTISFGLGTETPAITDADGNTIAPTRESDSSTTASAATTTSLPAITAVCVAIAAIGFGSQFGATFTCTA